MDAPAIDHVTIAGRDLKAMDNALAAAGLPTEYGGKHSNGVTHMSLAAFPDGSYIELISTERPGEPSPVWSKHFETAGSPCAWCVGSRNLPEEIDRLKARGIPVRGPVEYFRERPDASRIEWDLGFLDSGEPGAVLPFLIQDRTDRALRVRPSASIAASGLEGVAAVVIGCVKLKAGVELFRSAYGWPDPSAAGLYEDADLGVRLLRFPGKPVILAEAGEKGTWLSERIGRFGEAPCAFLLRSTRWKDTEGRLLFPTASRWYGETVRWLHIPDLPGVRIGVMK